MYKHDAHEDNVRKLQRLKRAVEAAKRNEPLSFSVVYDTLLNLATAYLCVLQWDEAEVALMEALEFSERPDQSSTVLYGLVEVCNGKEEFEKGASVCQRRLEALERFAGRGNAYGEAVQQFGNVRLQAGKFAEAAQLLEEALTLMTPDTLLYARCLASLSRALTQMDSLKRALDVHRKGMTLVCHLQCETHASTGSALHNAALIFARLGCFDRAIEHEERGIAVFDSTLGSTHGFTKTAQQQLLVYKHALTDPEMQRSLMSDSRLCRLCDGVTKGADACSGCGASLSDEGSNYHDRPVSKSVKRNADEKDCWLCGKAGTFTCSRCSMAHYCSRECQLKNWKAHKTFCQPVKF
jgi:tetratricopeptide (TPR) repeat protein